MIYFKVKEVYESEYTDGIDYYSIYATNIGIENANEEDTFVAESVDIVAKYWGLQLTKNTIMGQLLFNSEQAINKMMELLGPIRMIQLAPYHFMICDSIRKKAFTILKGSLGGLKQLGLITQDDYNKVETALGEQNINLTEY